MYNISYDILFLTSFVITFSDRGPTVVETDVGSNNSSQLPKAKYETVPRPRRTNDCCEGKLETKQESKLTFHICSHLRVSIDWTRLASLFLYSPLSYE